MKVLDFGSLNVDYVYSVPHIIEGGETLLSSGMEVFSGGKGLNQAMALAKAGVEVYMAGKIGEDGQVLLDDCAKYGSIRILYRPCRERAAIPSSRSMRKGRTALSSMAGQTRCRQKSTWMRCSGISGRGII